MGDATTGPGPAITVLVVEDEAADAAIVERHLRNYPGGAAVESVPTLAEARALLGSQTVDAVVLDLSLPDSRGVESVRALVASAPQVPIVVLTGLDDRGAGIDAVRAGAQEFIRKDVLDEQVLVRAIQFALERGRSTEALQRSVVELSEFASVTSHDLRAPLIGAGAYLTRLLREIDPALLGAEAAEAASLVRANLQAMESQITDLLASARSLDSSTATVDLARILREVVSARADVADGGAVVEIDGTLPTVRGHRARLSVLFSNLLDNAIKFAHPDRKPRVVVSAEKMDAAWRVDVADNGIGIDPERQRQIFSVFEQIDPSGGDGIGLGLAVSQRVVREHGGHLWVTSSPGEGAVFHFTLSGAPPVGSEA